MSNKFQNLYRRGCNSALQTREFLDEIKTIDHVEEELLKAIDEQKNLQNWDYVQMLILGIQYFPSKIFTPVLCEFLRNPIDELNLEDVVDVAFGIKDENLVDCLGQALDYQMDGDDYQHFNRKCLQTLANIGGEKAIGLIALATKSPYEQIRLEATRLLAKIGV